MKKEEIDAERINYLHKTFGDVSLGTQIDFLRWMDGQTADRDKWRDRCMRLIEVSKYIDSYGQAQAIKKEIDDEQTNRNV